VKDGLLAKRLHANVRAVADVREMGDVDHANLPPSARRQRAPARGARHARRCK
jgi:hypothetical protein